MLNACAEAIYPKQRKLPQRRNGHAHLRKNNKPRDFKEHVMLKPSQTYRLSKHENSHCDDTCIVSGLHAIFIDKFDHHVCPRANTRSSHSNYYLGTLHSSLHQTCTGRGSASRQQIYTNKDRYCHVAKMQANQ